MNVSPGSTVSQRSLSSSRPLGASCWSGFHGCIILMGYFASMSCVCGDHSLRHLVTLLDGSVSRGGTFCAWSSRSDQQLDRRDSRWVHSLCIPTSLGSQDTYQDSAESCHLDGHRSGIRTGLWGGIATGSFHYAKDHFPIGTVRGILESWDLLDAPDPPSHLKGTNPPASLSYEVIGWTDNGVEEVEEEWVSPWWYVCQQMSQPWMTWRVYREAYMPFRRISKQEAMRQKAMEAEMYQSMSARDFRICVR